MTLPRKKSRRANDGALYFADCIRVLALSQVLEAVILRAMEMNGELVSHVDEFVFDHAIAIIVVKASSHESGPGQLVFQFRR